MMYSSIDRRRSPSNAVYLAPQDALIAVADSSDSCDSDREKDQTRSKSVPKSSFALYAGIILTIFGSFQMSLNSVIVKYISVLNASELALFRFLILLVLSLPYLVYSQEKVIGVTGQRWPLFLRGALGGFSIYLSYCATKMMPIAEASVIISTTPCFVTILARIYLKESCDYVHVLSLILTVLGLCLLVKLPVIILTGSTEKFADTTYWTGFVLAFLAAFTGACALVFVRKLSNVHVSVIIFHFSWIAVIEMLIVSYVTSVDFTLPRCGLESAMVLVLGLFSFGGQLCFTFALRFEEVGTVAVVRFASRVVLIFLFQTFIFKNAPDGYSIGAAVLVSIAVILITLRKYLKERFKSSSPLLVKIKAQSR